MKASLVVLLFAASAFAQDPSAIPSAEAACGPKQVTFDAKQDPIQHPTPQPDAGKALVYLIEDLGRCVDCGRASLSLTDVTTRSSRWVSMATGSEPAEAGLIY
jgi:hypothetical protein